MLITHNLDKNNNKPPKTTYQKKDFIQTRSTLILCIMQLFWRKILLE